MSDPVDPNPQDEWKTVGSAPAGHHPTPDAFADDPSTEEKIYGRRAPTPPGTISARIGVLAIVAMTGLYIFTDLRDIEAPSQRVFPFAYALAIVPALALFWGVVALVRRVPGDSGRAILGIVLAIGAFGLAYATLQAAASKPQAGVSAPPDRTQLAPKDLSRWREEKLRREKQ